MCSAVLDVIQYAAWVCAIDNDLLNMVSRAGLQIRSADEKDLVDVVLTIEPHPDQQVHSFLSRLGFVSLLTLCPGRSAAGSQDSDTRFALASA